MFLGTWKTGAVLLSLSVLYGEEGIRHRISDSEPTLIVTDAENTERMPADLVGEMVVLDDELPRQSRRSFRDGGDVQRGSGQIYYTSGTTGLAKGILHAPLRTCARGVHLPQVEEGELFHGMGEWAWAAGIAPLLGPWRLGATQFVYRREEDSTRTSSRCSRHGVASGHGAHRDALDDGDRGRGRAPPQRFRRVCSAGAAQSGGYPLVSR